MSKINYNLREKGFAPLILVLIAAFGLLAFLLVSNFFEFRDKIFSRLFPKPSSYAEEVQLPEFLSNQILVKVKKEAKGKEVSFLNDLNNDVSKQVKVKSFEKIAKQGKNSNTDSDLFSWYLLKLDAPEETAKGSLIKVNGKFGLRLKADDKALEALQKVIDRLSKDSDVEDLDLNYIVHNTLVPNDPYYSSTGTWGQSYPDLWGMKKINMEEAWNEATNSASIVVADIDTGVDRNHEDLKDNMWTNPGETPGNAVDDDGNGYVDDYYGWNFVNNTGDPMDDHGHGSHTVGTIAGVGNNGTGVVGVNWTAKVMALKFLDNKGSGSLDNGIKGLQYAADNGARVSSNSWGCGCPSKAMDDAIKYEHDKGMITVVAAGNSNSDAIDFSPAGADYAITVAASDWNDTKPLFSNWGEKIDVAAPGVEILSTRASNNPMCTSNRTVGTSYCHVSGTSMATPHVAGLATLLLSKNPNLSNEEVRQIIRTGADDLGSSGKDRDFGYGRINAGKSMALSANHVLTPIITAPSSRTNLSGTTSLEIRGSIPGPNFKSFKIEAGVGRAPNNWITVATGTSQPNADTVLATIDTSTIGDGAYIFRLTATDTQDKNYQFQVADIIIDNFDASISSPSSLVSFGSANIFGTAQTKNNLVFANYTLEWGEGATPSSWSTAGITLKDGGLKPIVDNQLGTWNTSNLSDGNTYTLRLTAKASNGTTTLYTTTVTVDKDLVSGWPKAFPADLCFTDCRVSSVFADLDADGTQEVIVTSPTNKLYVFRKDGSNFPGFPISLAPGDYSVWPANVSDLDGDGKKEILLAAASDPHTVACTVSNGGSCYKKIYIIKSDGSFYPGWTNPLVFNFIEVSDATPMVADLDNDGKKELIVVDGFFANEAHLLHAYRLNGSEITGFPKSLPVTSAFVYAGTPSIVDLDHDGKVEIALGHGGVAYLYDNLGNLVPGWPVSPINSSSPPAAADLDGDGNLELIFGGRVITAYHKDGSLVSGWPKDGSYFGSAVSGPTVADLDGDGKDEVLVGPNNVAIYNQNVTQNTNIGSYISPMIADINRDNKLDFIGLRYSTIQIGNASNSVPFWQRAIPYNEASGDNRRLDYVPAVTADLDNNGSMEVSIGETTFLDPNRTPVLLYLWELPSSGTAPYYEWPLIGFNNTRTGRLVLSQQQPIPSSSPSPSPSFTPSPTPIPSSSANPTPSSNPSDTQAPTVPANLAASTVSSSQINLSWNPSTDNVGVTGYDVYRNSIKIATVTTTSYGDANLTASTQYSYTVRAFDKAGNVSNASNTATATTKAPPAATGTIQGVVASSTGGIVSNAKVSTKVGNSKKTVTTNSSGIYSFSSLPSGTYSLTFSKSGYVAQTISVVVNTSQITQNVTLIKR